MTETMTAEDIEAHKRRGHMSALRFNACDICNPPSLERSPTGSGTQPSDLGTERKGSGERSSPRSNLAERLYCAAQEEYGAISLGFSRLMREAATELERLEQCQREGWLHAKEVEDEYRKRTGHGFGEKQSYLTELALAGLRARLSCARAGYSDEASGEPVWENWSRDQLIGQIRYLRREIVNLRNLLECSPVETPYRLHEAETIIAQALTCGVDGDHAEWMLKAIAFLNLPAQSSLKATPVHSEEWLRQHRCPPDVPCLHCNPEKTSSPQMTMLPNDHHPGPRCSCRECLYRYPADVAGDV